MVSEPKKAINGLDGNGLLKTYSLLMEDKMAARVFGCARNYGWDSPFKHWAQIWKCWGWLHNIALSLMMCCYLFLLNLWWRLFVLQPWSWYLGHWGPNSKGGIAEASGRNWWTVLSLDWKNWQPIAWHSRWVCDVFVENLPTVYQ